MKRPRVLAIMGSGETAPAMIRVHRDLLTLLPPDARATIVDTTYGFQENADDISERMVEAFGQSMGRAFTVASYRRSDVDALTAATALARIADADYVLAGPGSPTYALRHWQGGPLAAAIATKLAQGGIVTMASAAALTLGAVTAPVYEIYKVGVDPEWAAGLNFLEPATGLRVAVIPHYDNAEGGNHDTRFCYLGERRLRMLEDTLPPGVFVLGVDGHTALVLDLDRQSVRVAGLGTVTVRAGGRSVSFGSGAELAIADLARAADRLAEGRDVERRSDEWAQAAPDRRASGEGQPEAFGEHGPEESTSGGPEASAVAALTAHDLRTALGALLDLDLALEGRIRSGEDSADLDDARARFRSLLVRVVETAGGPTSGDEARQALAPVVETILDLRARARAVGDFPTADRLRDRLTDAGIEVRDGAAGSEWSLTEVSGH